MTIALILGTICPTIDPETALHNHNGKDKTLKESVTTI